MRLALEAARRAARQGEVPVGACLVLAGEVIACEGNQMRALNSPFAHAEMLVMQQGLAKMATGRLDGYDLYITLEPCTMCAGAIALNHIRRLYYAADDEKMGNIAFFQSPRCHHRPEIYRGIAACEARDLLQNFFRHRREK